MWTLSRFHFGDGAVSDGVPGHKGYVAKRYRRRYLKHFYLDGKGRRWGRRGAAKRGKLSVNEHGEYSTKYGDWLHRANETVHVRDREMWSDRMGELRKKYRQEYADKFGRRLAEFTRMSDAKQYELRLQSARKKERRRLSALRVNALSSADGATKSRLRMEQRTKLDVIRFDAQDQRRDVIRQMAMERPAANWMTAENVGQRLTTQFMAELMHSDGDSARGDGQWLDLQYPGLPRPGDYETTEGLMRHSDRYFDGNAVAEHEVCSISLCVSDVVDVADGLYILRLTMTALLLFTDCFAAGNSTHFTLSFVFMD